MLCGSFRIATVQSANMGPAEIIDLGLQNTGRASTERTVLLLGGKTRVGREGREVMRVGRRASIGRERWRYMFAIKFLFFFGVVER